MVRCSLYFNKSGTAHNFLIKLKKEIKCLQYKFLQLM